MAMEEWWLLRLCRESHCIFAWMNDKSLWVLFCFKDFVPFGLLSITHAAKLSVMLLHTLHSLFWNPQCPFNQTMMSICCSLLNVFVCDVTDWVRADWRERSWQLCLFKEPDFLLQICSNVLQPSNITCLEETDSCWHGNRVGLCNFSW